ncbi:MAG: Periplasmic copper-binding protein (NosD) [Methanosaeta sp. PtaB.Bin039]|nr:MAG: Periplasmic copper-binding protein (NosD) [Methanosaeta sp. PtaB.Bin039]
MVNDEVHRRIGVLLAALTAALLLAAAQAATLTVCPDCQHRDLQSAIDAALPGDILEVHSGTYDGPINVIKPLQIRGADSGSGRPIIDGRKMGVPVSLQADGISLVGFAIRGSSPSSPGVLVASGGNTVSGNDISHHGTDGLRLESSGNNRIEDNLLAYNRRCGIHLIDSNNNFIRNNTASYNGDDGIFLEGSSSSQVFSNVASKNKRGIHLDLASGNAVRDNTLEENSLDGIGLDSSSANVLSGNDALHGYNGIRLLKSLENQITDNYAAYNSQNGFRLVSSSGNVLSLNRLIENRLDAYDDGQSDQWSSQGRGNRYTDSANCSDDEGDGICDQPYAIAGGECIDQYPLAGLPQIGLLFLEVWTHEDGQALEGTPNRLMIDFPTYHLSDSVLRFQQHLNLSPQALAILGSGQSLSGDMGGGASSGLYQLLDLPHSLGEFAVLSIEGDSATFKFGNETRTLQPDQSWQLRSEEVRRIGEARVLVNSTTTISNHGRVTMLQEGR